MCKKTLISYEQGTSTPNDIYLVTIKTLFENPGIIKPMIEANINRYNEEEYKKIVDKLTTIYSEEDNIIEVDNNLSEYNGYTKYSFNKLKNLILLLAKNTILKTKLLKEMFYCDFLSYKNTGKSITGLEYCKFQFGPVPKNYEATLDNLLKNKNIDITIKIENDYEYNTITSIDQANVKEFDTDELKIINKVTKYFENFNSKKNSRLCS